MTLDNNNNPSLWGVEFTLLVDRVRQGLLFLLEHFQDFYFPRTISTKATLNRQVLVFNEEEALARFAQSSFLDCRINAYPSSKFMRYQKQTPNFLFFDIDNPTIDLNQVLQDTLTNIKEKFENPNTQPTVLWSGKGYHVWLPINATALENESSFEDIQVYDPSRKFIQWAEQYLTNEQADPCHSKGVSFNNCMLRVPGSINSKINEEVKIIQRWNGIRPDIGPLIYDFFIDCADKKMMEIRGEQDKQARRVNRAYSKYWNG